MRLGISSRISLINEVAWARFAGRVFIEREGVKSASNEERILYVANSYLPTLQLSFGKPLQLLVGNGCIATELLSELQLRMRFGNRILGKKSTDWVLNRIKQFNPTLVVFCRYSGPHVELIIEIARAAGVPTIFHVDDDLLNVPIEIGKEKYAYHNEPSRLAAVRYLLRHVDLVYCSTAPLKRRLLAHTENILIEEGKIYCSGEVIVPAFNRPVRKIGYMGFDHAHDFEIALPAIIQILRRHSWIEFELFGSIPKPASLNEFRSRVRVIPAEPHYKKFMKKLASLDWDIGICPLADTDFNAVKANTKWVEYTSVGAAVICSSGMIYDECCDDGCGLLVSTSDDWVSAIESLIVDSTRRFQLVLNAQHRLEEAYSVNNLRNQVINIFQRAREIARLRNKSAESS